MKNNEININWFKKASTTFTKWNLNEFYEMDKYVLIPTYTRNIIEFFFNSLSVKYQFISKKNNFYKYIIEGESEIWISASNLKPYQNYYSNYGQKNIRKPFIEVSVSRDSIFIGENTYQLGFDLPVINGKIIYDDIFFTLSNVNYLMSYKGKKGDKEKEVSKTSRISIMQILELNETSPYRYFKNNNRNNLVKENQFGIFSYFKLLNENVKQKFNLYLQNNIIDLDEEKYLKENVSLYTSHKYIYKNGLKKRNPLLDYLFAFGLNEEIKQHTYVDMLNTIKKIDYKGSEKNLLVNSHIIPYSNDNLTATQVSDYKNGLKLTSFHDSLFDKYYISFSCENGEIMISNIIASTKIANSLKDLKIDEIFIKNEQNKIRREYLKHHNDVFKEKNY